jgi:uncharacterized protein YwqG
MKPDREIVRRAALEAGLGAWVDWVTEKALPSTRLKPSGGAALADGSRLGGTPVLPDDFSWPTWRGKPQSFIGQVKLEEMPAAGLPLPDSGVLSFFYASDQSTWGFDPADEGSATTVWFPDVTALKDRVFPSDLDSQGRFKPQALQLDLEWTVPAVFSMEIDYRHPQGALVVGREHVSPQIDVDALDRLTEQLGGPLEGPHHRMFGYPEQIQNEMRTECALVTNGIYVGDPSFVSDPRRAQLEEGAEAWQLLLQVDSDERLGTEWGDVGRIYYWIRKDDLEERRFSKSWLILQCS